MPANKHQKVDAITYSLNNLKSRAPFDSPTNVSAVNAKPSIKNAVNMWKFNKTPLIANCKSPIVELLFINHK